GVGPRRRSPHYSCAPNRGRRMRRNLKPSADPSLLHPHLGLPDPDFHALGEPFRLVNALAVQPRAVAGILILDEPVAAPADEPGMGARREIILQLQRGHRGTADCDLVVALEV